MADGETATAKIPAGRWTRPLAWIGRQSERFNAILIREIQRALNGRLFIIGFLILLTLCVLISFSTVLAGSEERNVDWNVFSLLLLSLCGVSFLGLPLMILGSVHAEIKERTFELLSITTLTAARIVWGEILTALGLFALYVSAVAPFMAFSYLLGGVDLREMFGGLLWSLLGSMFLTMLALLGATSPASETLIRVLIAGLGFAGLSMTAGLVNGYSRPLQAFWDEPNAWKFLAVFLTGYGTLGALLFTSTMSRMTFASANRAGPIRLAMAAHMLLTGGALWAVSEPHGWDGMILSWSLYSILILFFLGAAILGEEETLSRRLQRTNRFRFFLPTLWAFFLPGARRGLAFVFALGAAAALIATLAQTRARTLFMPGVAYAYLVLYLSVSYVICRIRLPLFQKPIMRRAMPLILFVVTLIFPGICMMTLDIRLNETLAAVNPVLWFTENEFGYRQNFDRDSVSVAILLIGGLAQILMLWPMVTGIVDGVRWMRSTRQEKAAVPQEKAA